ncbi:MULTISPECIES: nuclear transport factor 2 family protein [unclassified Streptomyces]|uniref:nuclear transport factor 2 family protein n=1 Tax=unclassified Streptomyces TaxID=2593676 RepID=UPI001BECAE35|nr:MULTISPECIES: nuclear transport factor 2 family protein [unclassified Streptomyces]MBT2408543.1 nuclear transport factor 2 family protein [Streptomyces sp. ISL-21]MBT2612688.1 nuclear transport factor 2 family protein [Streptomyces sp. ISL-87]
MTDHPNIVVFRRAMDAFSAGDMDALAEVFHPDVRWHIPGQSPLAGDFQGRDATFATFELDFRLSGGSYRPQLHDVLANDAHTVALLHATASREGMELDMDYAIVFHISDGRITEGWELWADQRAFDAFWS